MKKKTVLVCDNIAMYTLSYTEKNLRSLASWWYIPSHTEPVLHSFENNYRTSIKTWLAPVDLVLFKCTSDSGRSSSYQWKPQKKPSQQIWIADFCFYRKLVRVSVVFVIIIISVLHLLRCLHGLLLCLLQRSLFLHCRVVHLAHFWYYGVFLHGLRGWWRRVVVRVVLVSPAYVDVFEFPMERNDLFEAIVKPELSGHPWGMDKCAFNAGCPLNIR